MDAAEGAKALVEQGLVDPQKLIIKGGSAGGYTVLNCLIHHPGLFKAGLCSYRCIQPVHLGDGYTQI